MIKAKQQRCDLNLIKIGNMILKERVKRDIDEKQESFRRFTKAVANLIATDNSIRERLITAIFEEDRGSTHGYE